ncbi:MAG: hydrogenase formation protein HypD [Candidatus Hinthialibacter antarcticus]|nr:hydrogenase formation protein HypD [Candidatus Hinthialibacter antarcticus]
MKHLREYRDPEAAKRLLGEIHKTISRPCSMMEICGGQTHSILKNGLDQLLPESLNLIHGPGCPVCVTPTAILDKAFEIAARPEVIFCSFGDMLRVPGTNSDLFSVKANGGDVRVVYSPLDAVKLARENPEREVVFFAIGFETTTPPNAMAALQAKREGLKNFSLLVSQMRVPPAMTALLSLPDVQVEGFLAAGHVCAVMGYEEYPPIAQQFRVPIVVTGFEPVDLLQGVLACLKQLEQGRAEVENQYRRIVKREGNPAALRVLHEVFEPVDRAWRGLGVIPESGFGLREKFAGYDAEQRFGCANDAASHEPAECISGKILTGVQKPHQCAAFGVRCTPEHPLGAPMVSNEGACAAYYRYRRREIQAANVEK